MAGNEKTRVTIQVDVTNEGELKTLIADLERIAKGFPKAAKQAEKFAKTTKKTQIEMRKFGRGMQNASYQVQDFIVQVTGGVDPLRSFSQQAPQLLINMGALGAVIGVVAAAVPLLITAFTEAEEEVISLSDAIGELESSLNAMTNFSSGLDFNKWNEAWNKAEQSVRKTELALLEFRITAAEAEYADSITSAAKEINGELGTVQSALAAISDWFFQVENSAEVLKDVNIAESMGVNRATVDNIQEIFKAFEDGDKTANEMKDEMLAVGASTQQANAEFYTLIENMYKLAKAREDLTKAGQQAGAAAGGGLLPVNSKGGGGDKLQRIYANNPYEETFKQAEANLKLADSYTMLYDPVAAYEAELQKIIQIQGLLSPEVAAKAVEAAAKAYEQATEQITFASQAAEVFEQSFNTAFDGVAMGTQQVSDAFRNMAKVIIAQLLKIAAYKTIAGFDWTGGTFGGQTAWGSTSAQGNAFSGGNVVPFAKGGVVNTPTIFPMARGGVGLMGEAGSEAVMPLRRMGNGNLGVESSGMNVTVNNMAQGVSVNPRQGSDGLTIDVVLAQAARAVQSGGNVFADSIEKTYSVNRGRGVY